MMDLITSNAALIGLLFFFSFFCLMFMWTFRPGSKKIYKQHAQIPLEETEE
jgi:cbb3-type cytochrome oxidase subunit 3